MKKIVSILIFSIITVLAFTSCKKNNPCETTLCLHDSACIDGSCMCTTGFEGINCETEVRSKFLGVWTGTGMCGTEPAGSFSTIITTGSNTQTILMNLDGVVQGIVNGTDVTFQQQPYNGVIVFGTGHITNNVLSIALTFTNGVNDFSCDFTITK